MRLTWEEEGRGLQCGGPRRPKEARPGSPTVMKAPFPGEPVTETWKEAERGAQGLQWGGGGCCQCTGGAAVTGGLPSRGRLRGLALRVPA